MDYDLPPLPIPAPSAPPQAESSRRHSHRSKDRYSTRDLTTLLLLEQREHRETQLQLSRVSEQLRLETLRADTAEENLKQTTDRLKSVNEARWSAVREAARANESLGLYKFQLDKAQQEINRAQAVFDIVEKERYEAEVQGAKSRTTARRLHEQHKIYVAREEGRALGLREGIQAGRLGVERDSTIYDPSIAGFADLNLEDYDADLYEGELASPTGDYNALGEPGPSSALRNFPAAVAATSNARQTPDPVPVPAPAPPPIPVPAPPTVPAAAAPLSPLFTPFHDIHPTPVHNQAPHPIDHYAVPPDNYIPVVASGNGSLPSIPPPHEFINQTPNQPQNRAPSVVTEHTIAPSAFARAMSPRQGSVRTESVRRAPSVNGSIRPVQMPTGTSEYGGSSRGPAPPRSASSGGIGITVVPPSGPQSHASSSRHVGAPSMGDSFFGPPGTSPMPGGYALPTEGYNNQQYRHYHDADDNQSEGTHSSALQTSTPDTLTTPPELRRPHVPTPPDWRGY